MRSFVPMAALVLLSSSLLSAQPQRPKIIDAHVHHNGDPAFLAKLTEKLAAIDGQALLITAQKDLVSVSSFIGSNPGRLIGLGQLSLDDPDAVAIVDRFHAAGFRGLGELTGPLYPFDDRRYWPIYERAEKHGMIILFHTGIVNRTRPDFSSDVSSDRMRITTLDLIARKFPKLTLIAAHLGNPDYAWAAELGRWNPNLFFDVSGSTLAKKRADLAFFRTIFWWDDLVSPHSPKSSTSAFEKLVFGSDVFNGDLGEFDRELELYRKMLQACGVSATAQENIFSGTLWKVLNRR